MRGRQQNTESASSETPATETPELFDARSDLVPTQFLLPKAQKAELRKRSFEEGRSMSEIAREALDAYFRS